MIDRGSVVNGPEMVLMADSAGPSGSDVTPAEANSVPPDPYAHTPNTLPAPLADPGGTVPPPEGAAGAAGVAVSGPARPKKGPYMPGAYPQGT